MFDLKGRVALVTGASRGIGRAIAVALAARGAYVVLGYASNDGAAAEALGAVRAVGDGEVLKFDVAKSDEVNAAVENVTARKGTVGVLVANAGIAVDGLMLRVKDEDIEKTFATNVNGVMYLTRAVLRGMMKARWGRIITLSSVVADSGNAGQAVYGASKGALVALTRSLAREYGSRGITVNAVAPGFIETDMTAGIPVEARAKMVEATPVGRVGKPEDIAAAVVYLASPEAGFVTGQVLRVNGGLYV